MAEFIWTGNYRIALPEGVDPIEFSNELAVRIANIFDDLDVLAVGDAKIEEATDEEVADGEEAAESSPD